MLSRNPSRWAYKLLSKDPTKIIYSLLSQNPSQWAYKILKNKPHEINWKFFSSNPYLFKLIKTDYKLFDVLLHKKLI